MTSKLTSPIRCGDEAGSPPSEDAAPPAGAAKAGETSAGIPAEPGKADEAEQAGPAVVPAVGSPSAMAAPCESDVPVACAAEAKDGGTKAPAAEPAIVGTPKAAPAAVPRAKGWTARAGRMPAAAAALVLALGGGYGIGAATTPRDGADSGRTAQLLEAATRDLREAHGQLGRLAAELTSIRSAVEGIKGDREAARSDILAKQAQLSDRVERAGQDSASRIARLAEQLDRIERGQREAARQAAAEKADRAERREKAAAASVPPAKPGPAPAKPNADSHADPAHTGSIGEAKAAEKLDPRKTPLAGFVVRDYDDGFALIETRSGRYIDVAVGYNLPGAGRVEAIERRGRQWVVITPKGYIGER